MGILGAAAISAVAGIGSAVIGSDSSSNAADAQVQAANTASQTTLDMFNQTSAREQPWVGSGQSALAELMSEMGLSQPAATAPSYGSPYGASYGGFSGGTPYNNYADLNFGDTAGGNAMRRLMMGGTGGFQTASPYTRTPVAAAANPMAGSLVAPFTQAQFQQSPGYQYQMDQMMGAVQNSAAARGGLVSGNALRALQSNAGGLANQDWWNAQNNYQQQQQQRFNMLQTLSGSGQNAAANLGALGANAASTIGANTIGAGNAASAGIVAGGQNWSNLLNNQSFLQGVQGLFSGGSQPQLDYNFLNSDPSALQFGLTA